MLFSVITPSFGQLDWLRLCMASVRDQAAAAARQTADRPAVAVEHIIQDAGSPGIGEFARAAGASFYQDGVFQSGPAPSPAGQAEPYSLKIFSEKDSGMYDAVNRGLKKASGELCSYLNCDEQYLPGTLAYVTDWFRDHPGVDTLYGDALVTGPSGDYLCDRKCLPPTLLHSLVSGNLSAFTSSTFFRRSIVDRGLLFDPDWRVVGDVVWNISLIRAGVRRAACGRTLSTFTHTGDNLTFRPAAVEECRRLLASAPAWARAGRSLILAHYRFRRLLAGAYFCKPHSYRVYTRETPAARREFIVDHPRFRWPAKSLPG